MLGVYVLHKSPAINKFKGKTAYKYTYIWVQVKRSFDINLEKKKTSGNLDKPKQVDPEIRNV
jgi:hypothetical protein